MAVPPPLSAPAADKAALRKRLRSTRARHVETLGPEGVEIGAARIARRLAPLLEEPGAIGGYVAHRGEPDVLGFLLAAHGRGRVVALPRVDDGDIRFVAWRPEMVLTAGFGGIREPRADAEIEPATLLVPLVGFDRQGRRLGQGAGCYDRWLAAHRGASAIGIAWSVQECPEIPADPWDVPLDAIVTEKEWIAP